ncbi:MAG: hypothetical protein ACYCO3_05920 [Mycobacteriales bacterium]
MAVTPGAAALLELVLDELDEEAGFEELLPQAAASRTTATPMAAKPDAVRGRRRGLVNMGDSLAGARRTRF